MSDGRTVEQREADEHLTEAIERARKVWAGDETEGWVLTEYIVGYVSQGWDDEGDQMTCVGRLMGPASVPPHRALGLLEYLAARYRKLISSDDDD